MSPSQRNDPSKRLSTDLSKLNIDIRSAQTNPSIDNQKKTHVVRNDDIKLEPSAQRMSQIRNDNEQKPKSSFLSNLLDRDSNNVKNNNHKRQESDSKLSLNFVRGFRRENSDFFPLSKRHSAILGERQINAIAPNAPHRSSAIYSKNNAQSNKNNGEPVLTDFVCREYLDNSQQPSASLTPSNVNNKHNSNNNSNNSNNKNRSSFNFLAPRREKTESVILLRNSANRSLLLDKQQVNTHTQIP